MKGSVLERILSALFPVFAFVALFAVRTVYGLLFEGEPYTLPHFLAGFSVTLVFIVVGGLLLVLGAWPFIRVAAIAAALFGASTAAGAAPILEIEGNNSIAGAQAIPASAFTTPVPAGVFNLGYPTATISGNGDGGANDVDFYAFAANAGSVYFDIDNDPFTFDTLLALFDSSRTLIAFGDSSVNPPPNPTGAGDPGSPDGGDAFIGVFSLSAAGTYYIAVSAAGNFPNGAANPAGFTALTRPVDGGPGGVSIMGATPGDSSYFLGAVSGNGTSPYTLHLSLQSPATQPVPVPEPGTLLLFGAGMSTLAARMRRRR